jgi:hypothetical protein
MQNLAIAGIVVGVTVSAAWTGFLVFELLRVIGTLVSKCQLWHEKTLALTRLRLAVTLSNGMGKAIKITRSVCGDASMGELGAMLRRAAKLNDSPGGGIHARRPQRGANGTTRPGAGAGMGENRRPAPRTPPPPPEAKLEQQLSNPIAEEALAEPVVGTTRILADLVAKQVVGTMRILADLVAVPVAGTMRILADLVAMDTEQLIGLFLFGVFVGFAAYAFVALIQSI